MTDRLLTHTEQGLLARLISEIEEAPGTSGLILTDVDHSLLSSAWQKAIRRSDADLATSCVMALHAADPAYVWRRIRGIALEEVSAADLELVGQVIAIAGKTALRQKLGDQRLIGHLTRRLALAPKCRTACDLLMWLDPPRPVDWSAVQENFRSPPAPWSLQLIADQASAWQSVVNRSTYKQGKWVQLTQGSATRRDQLLEWAECPPLVRYIVQRGSGTDSLNSLLAPVYQLSRTSAERFAMVDLHPSSTEEIGHLPAYAYCLFSAPGRAALRQLLKNAPELVRFCGQAGVTDPLRAIGHTVFQLEGGYCHQVYEVSHGLEIKLQSEQATLERFGVAAQWQSSLRGRVHALLPKLNQYRQQVLQSVQIARAKQENADPFPACSQHLDG